MILWTEMDDYLRGAGGEGGIRTPGTLARTPHFECGAIDHSATSPGRAAKGAFASPLVARRLSWGQAAGKAIDGKTAADQALADLARSEGPSSPPRYRRDRDDELSSEQALTVSSAGPTPR